MVLVLLACVATALGSGQDIIDDYTVNNGQITGCYTDAEFREALRIARTNDRLYGNAVDVIQEARATHTATEPGGTCEGAAVPEEAEEPGSGTGAGLWIGLAAAVGLIAVGAGLWARRTGGDDDPSAGDEGTGDDTPDPDRT